MRFGDSQLGGNLQVFKDKGNAAWVKASIEPMKFHGDGPKQFRCSATLVDGTVLPCVSMESWPRLIDVAVKRISKLQPADTRVCFLSSKEQKESVRAYRNAISALACGGNTISPSDILELKPSPYAISPKLLRKIRGETSMGWTQFGATMNDGQEFEFGTGFNLEFFDMPEGYCGNDIVKITQRKRDHEHVRGLKIYRERIFFKCYITGL